MLKKILLAVVLVASVLALTALAPSRGYIKPGSGTSTIQRNFQYAIKSLIIAPETQRVRIILVPSYAQDDTFWCDPGDVCSFDGGYDAITGFILQRPVATDVIVKWE